MEGMRISGLDNFAKGFWGPPSHLVEYSYLDHLSDHSSQTDFFLQENWNGISKREGGKEEGKRRWKSKGYMFHFLEKVRHRRGRDLPKVRGAASHMKTESRALVCRDLCQVAGSRVDLGTHVEAQAATSGNCWVWSL